MHPVEPLLQASIREVNVVVRKVESVLLRKGRVRLVDLAREASSLDGQEPGKMEHLQMSAQFGEVPKTQFTSEGAMSRLSFPPSPTARPRTGSGDTC